jgi:endonuclease/exonuclease/phosphatase family metal-dependent hydrolase
VRHHFRPKWAAALCFFTIVYGLLFTSVDYDTTKVAMVSSDSLRIITYNVQHLPWEVLNKFPNSKYRAKRQAELLVNYDIIGLNEVFVDRRRNEICQILKDAWGADFHSVTSHQADRSVFGLDSGLLLLTRLPVLESHTLTFGNDSRLRDRGFIADGYAKKGAIHARIQYRSPDQQTIDIDCFVTHLESLDAARRDEQISMLTKFMIQHSLADNPMLLLGDLNIADDGAELSNTDSQYCRLQRELSTVRETWSDLGQMIEASEQSTFDANSPTGGQRLDYILLSDALRGPSLIPLSSSVQRFADPHVVFLSDHSALEADFGLSD